MVKKKLSGFYCVECGAEWPKWMGKCPECGMWNTLKELESRSSEMKGAITTSSLDVKELSCRRIALGDPEFERVLGGGLVPGSLTLLAGDPGVGKSTLLTKVMGKFCSLNQKKGLYISGEETISQVGSRVKRLDSCHRDFHLCHTQSWEQALGSIKTLRPHWIILDSIQTMKTSDSSHQMGGSSQVKDLTNLITQWAKASEIPVLIVGHITKDGAVAGPKLLEHMVDTVLYFEWNKKQNLRVLTARKNRFGDTNEMGFYLMKENSIEPYGQYLVKKISDIRLKEYGECLGLLLKNKKLVPCVCQVLLIENHSGVPKRVVEGFDSNRLNLLLAILEKHLGIKMHTKDIFLHLSFDLGKKEQYFDVPILLSLISAFRKKKVRSSVLAHGKLELNGSIQIQKLSEVKELGSLSLLNVNHVSELLKNGLADEINKAS